MTTNIMQCMFLMKRMDNNLLRLQYNISTLTILTLNDKIISVFVGRGNIKYTIRKEIINFISFIFISHHHYNWEKRHYHIVPSEVSFLPSYCNCCLGKITLQQNITVKVLLKLLWYSEFLPSINYLCYHRMLLISITFPTFNIYVRCNITFHNLIKAFSRYKVQ
jgi:hypothetical protein